MTRPRTFPNRSRRIAFVLLALAALAVTAEIYGPALHGPFLLDDVANLDPLTGWLSGRYDWQHVVFGNDAGLFGRPISMATFLLDAAVSGSTDSFAFKLTNLGIHLACGLALLWLAWHMFRRWTRTREHAKWFALVLMAWWLWLPLNVDTVLYVVQRMAQLAALFMLLALGCYAAARERIERGQPGGRWLLWLGVPALTALAALSKENGVLAIPLAFVLELFLFNRAGARRPRSIRWFFGLTLGLPVLAGIVFVAVDPKFILGGYASRPFTFGERLLTEPRVLWSYVQTLLVPVGPRMGFFQDNFPVSTGWLHPWTTPPAIFAWLAVAVIGWLWRKGNPLFGAGAFFFLVGQSMESGVLPLEIYFEHRNYLPSFGVLLAVIGTLVWTWQRSPPPTAAFRRIAGALGAVALALLATATWGHVQSWRTAGDFYAAQAVFNPTSPRLQSAIAVQAMNAGDLDAALQHIAIAARYLPPADQAAPAMWSFLAYCRARETPPGPLYTELAGRAQGPISLADMTAFEQVALATVHGCPDVDIPHLRAIMQQWLGSTPSPARAQPVWRTRSDLARLVAQGGDIAAARDLAHRAWIDSGYKNDIGIFLFQLNASLGDVAACREVLAKLQRSYGDGDRKVDDAIVTFRRALADGSIGPATSPPTAPDSKK